MPSLTEPKETKPRKVVGRSVAITLGIICILLIAAIAISDNPSQTDRISDKAVSFVLNNFDPSMNLVSEVTEGTPNSLNFPGNVFWIDSDNVFAYVLLRSHNITVANKIESSLIHYATYYDLPNDSNGFPQDFKHDPILSALNTEDHDAPIFGVARAAARAKESAFKTRYTNIAAIMKPTKSP